jgi:hypothetical protein
VFDKIEEAVKRLNQKQPLYSGMHPKKEKQPLETVQIIIVNFS